MLETLDYLREFHTASVFLRLTLAMILGGLIGLERGRMRRPAGFRTYLLVCLGASLTMILSQYCYHLQSTEWVGLIGKTPIDISRLGAQVISGIGFLGAGTMIITRRQHVKGLTTAAGLWTSGCMGLA
ncbi:MAG: MgtC/SapB family protein, partial [Firmicutes bacterium]|nr:MgtC/SapB family protein [Bacillota bacterium]